MQVPFWALKPWKDVATFDSTHENQNIYSEYIIKHKHDHQIRNILELASKQQMFLYR